MIADDDNPYRSPGPTADAPGGLVEAAGRLTLSFRLREPDVGRLHSYVCWHRLTRQLLTLFLAVLAIFVGGAFFLVPALGAGPIGYVVAVALAAGSFLLRLRGARRQTIAASRSAHAFLDRTVTIGPEGVDVRIADLIETRYAWAAFHSIVRTKTDLILFVIPTYGQVIPLREFATDDQADRFEQAARHWQEGRGLLPPR